MKAEEFVKLLISAVKGLSYKEIRIPIPLEGTEEEDAIVELHNKDYITTIVISYTPLYKYSFITCISLKKIAGQQEDMIKLGECIGRLNLYYFNQGIPLRVTYNSSDILISRDIPKADLNHAENPKSIISSSLKQTIETAEKLKDFLKKIPSLPLP